MHLPCGSRKEKAMWDPPGSRLSKAATLTDWEFEDFHREQQSCVKEDLLRCR